MAVNCMEHIEIIKAGFVQNRKLLLAIGDESRQAIIAVLMGRSCTGMRVGEIAAGTHLSRPAVSHHLKILRECGLVTLDKQGTMNFYALNIGEEFQSLYNLIQLITQLKESKLI